MEQTQPGRMTIDQLLAKLDALHEAATEGEWVSGRPDMATVVGGFDSKWVYADDKYIIVASSRDCEDWPEVMANANFVAAAHNHYPALRAEIKRLREELAIALAQADSEAKPTDGGFVVTCKREGKLCCQTYRAPTEAEAIANWERMQDESAPFEAEGK